MTALVRLAILVLGALVALLAVSFIALALWMYMTGY